MKRSLLIFALLLCAAAWPSSSLRAGISELLCAAIDPLLGELEFGRGGRASIRSAPVSELRRPGEQVTSDATLRLTLAGTRAESITSINLRREFYLPLVILIAATLAAPLSLWHRVAALALGVPLAFATCFGGLYLTICYLFAHQAPQFYPLSARGLQLLDGLVGAILMPPSLRFFIPLVLAAWALVLSRPRGSGRPSSPRTAADPRA